MMNEVLLKEHVSYIDLACEHWTQDLLFAPQVSVAEITRELIPRTSGVYVLRHEGDIKYIGKSNNLRARICSQHLGPRMRSSTLRRKLSKFLNTPEEELITAWLQTAYIAWLAIGDHRLTLAIEDHAIEKLKPPFNGCI